MMACIKWLLSLPILQNTVLAIPVHTSSNAPFSMAIFNHACAAPITALLLDTDYLLEKHAHDVEPAILKRMQASVDRLRLLSNSLTSLTDELFDVTEVITSCTLLFTSRAEITVDVEATIAAASCRGSKLLFSEVVVCLLSNAIESYESNSKKRVMIILRQRNNLLEISIKDHGCGMNKLEQLVCCLDGVSCKKKSTGLGLPFCIRTIKNYFRGKLLLNSIKSVGTTVSILVPFYSVQSM